MKFLKVDNYREYSSYYFRLCSDKNTWEEISNIIESLLDEQYCKHNTEVGCKISAEVVELTQEQVDEVGIED